jgi:hypothetical protein
LFGTWSLFKSRVMFLEISTFITSLLT